MKKLMVLGCFAAGFCTSIAHADFTFFSTEFDACANTSTHWSGTGRGSNWLIGECVYEGDGVLQFDTEHTSFSIEISAHKKSGIALCPEVAHETINGICKNRKITMYTDFGNIEGHVNKIRGKANGTITVSPGITAEVSVQFTTTD